jgi:pyruvate,water dikinase
LPQQPIPEIPGGLSDEGITATGIKSIVSIPGKIGNSPEISDGAGLVRAEHIITETGKHPYYLVKQNPEELISSLLDKLGSIAKAFYPKSVWYRSLDVRSDEFRELEGGEHEPSENNPIMGWHGIRRSLDQPDLLKIEIEVIKRLQEEGLSNIVLGLSFITSVEELRLVREMAGFPLKIGIMIETPAAGLEIENFCKEGIAFAAIGLNDLTQLTLGVDRDNSKISKLYSELNPAVINLLKHILRTCRKYSVETSVYGDFVSDPRTAEALVGLGVGSISAEPDNLEEVRKIISRTERKLILDNLRNRPGIK